MNLSTQAAGLTLANPILPGSGPLTGNAKRMLALAGQGIGAIVTKTIAPEAASVGRPCIAGRRDMLFNSEAWSEYAASVWAEEYLPALRRESSTPVIASVGYDAEDLRRIVPMLEPYCEGYEYIPRYVGKDFVEVGKIAAALRALTAKPIWVKMNANIPDPVGFARVCRNSGANGVTAITSLGPNLVVDIANRRPLIGIPSGYVWTSGPAIKPLALAYVNMIKTAFPDLSVLASGGCSSADDVIEFLLAGADAVQILTDALFRGRNRFAAILADLPAAMEKHGFSGVEEVKRTGLGPVVVSDAPSFPVFDAKKCNGCGLCAGNCPYFALEMRDGLPVVDDVECFGCGLCQTRCPKQAITNVIQA